MTRILVVEDNELNRDMLSRRLSRRGYEVVLAGDGREGRRDESKAQRVVDVLVHGLNSE